MAHEKYQKAVDRFMKKVKPEGECWIFHGLHCRRGYGHYTVRKPRLKLITAHRYSYLLFALGTSDLSALTRIAHLTIDHTCQTRDCVNPKHLEAIPRWANELRAEVNRLLSTHGRVSPSMLHRIYTRFESELSRIPEEPCHRQAC